ncbi:MAG TPA: hypothetical protein VK116_07930 [Planctomycetota bacterium]|nr:hypothetical protein [Planctomycetota bacterium]
MAGERAPSIVVVLPFEVSPGRSELEAAAAELRNAIVARLKKLSGLAVVAASSLAGVERTGNSAEICALLGADWLIEGGVKGYRDSLQLSILMTRARDRAYVWGGLFGVEPTELERLSERASDEVWDEIRRRMEE